PWSPSCCRQSTPPPIYRTSRPSRIPLSCRLLLPPATSIESAVCWIRPERRVWRGFRLIGAGRFAFSGGLDKDGSRHPGRREDGSPERGPREHWRCRGRKKV